MEGFQKTEYLGLNIVTNSNVFDVDPLRENFSRLEDKTKENAENITNIKLLDSSVKITDESGVAIDKTAKDIFKLHTEAINLLKQDLIGVEAIDAETLELLEGV